MAIAACRRLTDRCRSGLFLIVKFAEFTQIGNVKTRQRALCVHPELCCRPALPLPGGDFSSVKISNLPAACCEKRPMDNSPRSWRTPSRAMACVACE